MTYERPTIRHIASVMRGPLALVPDYIKMTMTAYVGGRDSRADTAAMYQIAERIGENFHISYPLERFD